MKAKKCLSLAARVCLFAGLIGYAGAACSLFGTETSEKQATLPLHVALTQLAATVEAEKSAQPGATPSPAGSQTKAVIDPITAGSLQPVAAVGRTNVHDFVWLPDGKGLVLATEGELFAYGYREPEPGAPADMSPGSGRVSTNKPSMLTVAQEQGTVAWISDQHVVMAVNPESGAGAETLDETEAPVTGLAISPQGDSLAYSTYDSALRVSTADEDPGPQVWQAPSWLANLSYSPDGGSLGGADLPNFMVYIFDAQTGEVERNLQWSESDSPALYGAFFAPDWQNLAWVARGTVQLMDVGGGTTGPMLNHEDSVSVIAWSPDSRLLATAAAGTVESEFAPIVIIWEVSSGQAVNTLVQKASVQSLSFSPDGGVLAILDSGGQLQMWAVEQ